MLPGTYALRADALGFQPEERAGLELTVASHTEVNFTLRLSAAGTAAVPGPPSAPGRTGHPNILSIMYGSDAAVPQAVLVQLPAQLTETLLTSVSRLIDERRILELPLSGRDVYTLLVLQPGVTSDNATGRGLGFSVNGQRVSSSNFLLDGVDNNDLLVTGPATLVSADAIKEYRMTTNNFTAEFGRSSGFLANAITRAGTNAVHGTLYEFFGHDRINANSFAYNRQGARRPPFRQNQYGVSLGGPVRRDRLFVFGNFEQSRSSSESTPLQVLVPSQVLISILPEGNRAKQLLTQFPPPRGEPLPTPGFEFFALKSFVIPAVQQNTFTLGRSDYVFPGGSRRLSARYALSRQTTDNFIFSIYPGLNAPLIVQSQSLAANYTDELAGGSNELKFGYTRNSVSARQPHPELPTVASNDGSLAVTGLWLPGMESISDYFFRNVSFHVVDNVKKLMGRHAIGMGGEWRLARSDSLSSLVGNGVYFFEEGADFFNPSQKPVGLLLPLSRRTGLPASANDYWRFYRQGEWAAFFQDDLKLTSRLTLNLGLRFEYFGVPAGRKTTRDSNFIFGEGKTVEETLAAKLTAEFDERTGSPNTADRFVQQLFAQLKAEMEQR